MSEDDKFFTLVIEGDIRKAGNLFRAEFPFGKVVGMGCGNAFAREDALNAAIDYACDHAGDGIYWLREWAEGDPECMAKLAQSLADPLSDPKNPASETPAK